MIALVCIFVYPAEAEAEELNQAVVNPTPVVIQSPNAYRARSQWRTVPNHQHRSAQGGEGGGIPDPAADVLHIKIRFGYFGILTDVPVNIVRLSHNTQKNGWFQFAASSNGVTVVKDPQLELPADSAMESSWPTTITGYEFLIGNGRRLVLAEWNPKNCPDGAELDLGYIQPNIGERYAHVDIANTNWFRLHWTLFPGRWNFPGSALDGSHYGYSLEKDERTLSHEKSGVVLLQTRYNSFDPSENCVRFEYGNLFEIVGLERSDRIDPGSGPSQPKQQALSRR